jgi:glycosyltransferase involved in cell wall biosynthesis
MNYHFSLPNKVFDYMHAGIPILATKLPEIENLVNQYHIGTFIENHDPKHIAAQIQEFLNSKEYLEYKSNTVIAAVANNWKSEKQKLTELFEGIN